MPQLNPTPWLMILVVSWMTLLILFAPKIAPALPQNPPLMGDQTPYKASPWSWPWT